MNSRVTLIGSLFFAGFVAFCPAADTDRLSLETTQQPIAWTIRFKSRPVLVYSFAPEKHKSYVKEFYTLQGENLLRDAPYDHLHHHALMYGITVNGLDFWAETPGCGVQKPIHTSRPEFGTNAQGQPQATFSQTIHWLAPPDAFLPDTAKVALLLEQRTLTLTVNEAARETCLQWNSKFTVGSKTNQVTLSGANYHGLGVRFRQELDPLARHSIAGHIPDLSDNKQDVSPGAWGAVTFDLAGKPATLAIYGIPGNPGGPTRFFAMRTPFAYLSATQGLDKNPRAYRSGDVFNLGYTIVLYPALKSPEFLAQRGKR